MAEEQSAEGTKHGEILRVYLRTYNFAILVRFLHLAGKVWLCRCLVAHMLVLVAQRVNQLFGICAKCVLAVFAGSICERYEVLVVREGTEGNRSLCNHQQTRYVEGRWTYHNFTLPFLRPVILEDFVEHFVPSLHVTNLCELPVLVKHDGAAIHPKCDSGYVLLASVLQLLLQFFFVNVPVACSLGAGEELGVWTERCPERAFIAWIPNEPAIKVPVFRQMPDCESFPPS